MGWCYTAHRQGGEREQPSGDESLAVIGPLDVGRQIAGLLIGRMVSVRVVFFLAEGGYLDIRCGGDMVFATCRGSWSTGPKTRQLSDETTSRPMETHHQPTMSTQSPQQYVFERIGRIHSCYQQKFAIPRQSGAVPEAPATIELLGDAAVPQSVRGLDQFSHIWVQFVFDQHLDTGWRPTVRPPRLGGNRRVGVFASRAPHRPNPIGMSAVRLQGIECDCVGVRIHVLGGDFLDGTPVLDIKPYLPYSDTISEAEAGFAPALTPTHEVTFTEQADRQLRATQEFDTNRTRRIIMDTLAYNPRPSANRDPTPDNPFATRMCGLDIHWFEQDGIIRVCAVKQLGAP